MNIKIVAFDLDGVIINSLPNMENAWRNTCEKNNLKIPFFKYKKLIGLPFKKILIKLKIKDNLDKIQKDYLLYSIKNISLVRCYPNIKKIINKLNKKYKIVIITSKDRKRSKYILKIKKVKYDMLITPNDVKNGKPHPEAIQKVLKKFKLKENNIIYIGDTIYDLKFAKNAKIKFLFARWGYGFIKVAKEQILKEPSLIIDKLKT